MGTPQVSPTLSQAWDEYATDHEHLLAPLTGHIALTMVTLVEVRLPSAPQLLNIACGPCDRRRRSRRVREARGGFCARHGRLSSHGGWPCPI